MRILVISNLYPPFYVGGYELGCQDVVVGLKKRRHEVRVLTSTYGVGKPESDGEIYRWLHADLCPKGQGLFTLPKLLKKEMINQMAFRDFCRTFRPDIVYFWNLTHVSISIAFLAQKMRLRTGYFVFDNWLSGWQSDPWFSLWNRYSRRPVNKFGKIMLGFPLKLLGFLPNGDCLDLRHVQFASQYLKEFALAAGRPVADAKVIHFGIDTKRYSFKPFLNNPKRLLYIGQIVRHKGVHTAVEALKTIVHDPQHKSTTLSIVGGSIIPEYEAHIRHMVNSLNLERNVRFPGLILREYLPSIYHGHDILIFPSIWEEPFGMVLLEAMGSGLAVAGTATGGSSEILQDGVNALIFPKEDTEACAKQILRLMRDSELFEITRRNARRTVEDKFRFEEMMKKIDESLYEAVEC